MNRYRKLFYMVKAFNYPVVRSTTGINNSVFQSVRCCSDLKESRAIDDSQTVIEKNIYSDAVDNTSSEIVTGNQRRNYSVTCPIEVQDLSDYGSVLKPSFNFAAYADKSPVLQKLIELGVRLYEWEKKLQDVQFVLTLDYDRDIKPYISFLTKHGVPLNSLGNFITKNPGIFLEDLDDLEVRINYLQSKKFDNGMIANIISRNPKWLSNPVRQIDQKLGYLQQAFDLKGDQVRNMVTREPNLANVPKRKLYLHVLTLHEEMELEKKEVTQLVVAVPHLLKISAQDYLSSYDYLRRVMKIPKTLLLKTPKILGLRKHKIDERHKFLIGLGKDQYNPLLPGYVALETFYCLTDEEFCKQVAKTSLETFYEFLKTF